jgi:hypothetical protein
MAKPGNERRAGGRPRREGSTVIPPAELRSLEFRMRMLPGITPRQELNFERELDLYLLERELIGEGTPLSMSIRSDSRDLTVTDQVDLLAWLMSLALVVDAEVAIPASTVNGEEPGEGGPGSFKLFRASHSDLAVPPVLELYRLGRIRPEFVVEVLRE